MFNLLKIKNYPILAFSTLEKYIYATFILFLSYFSNYNLTIFKYYYILSVIFRN